MCDLHRSAEQRFLPPSTYNLDELRRRIHQMFDGHVRRDEIKLTSRSGSLLMSKERIGMNRLRRSRESTCRRCACPPGERGLSRLFSIREGRIVSAVEVELTMASDTRCPGAARIRLRIQEVWRQSPLKACDLNILVRRSTRLIGGRSRDDARPDGSVNVVSVPRIASARRSTTNTVPIWSWHE
jgi:hypothetical protein